MSVGAVEDNGYIMIVYFHRPLNVQFCIALEPMKLQRLCVVQQTNKKLKSLIQVN